MLVNQSLILLRFRTRGLETPNHGLAHLLQELGEKDSFYFHTHLAQAFPVVNLSPVLQAQGIKGAQARGPGRPRRE
ncbi:MAG: hypothetical protein A2Y80_02650 [Deltaproteobacteria bacterium RBG_13_58_19]|nr:MAG: hypothetical protein A2Y80_02650 [Deltaproteobacteria bacterium RBG_13_58_19]